MTLDHQPEMNRQELLEHYERIIDITLQLNSTFDLTALLKKIVDAATELTRTEAASIMLYDATEKKLRFSTASNIKPHQLERILIPLEGSIAGWIFQHGEPRVIQSAADEPLHFQGVDREIDFVSRNLLGVPMRTHEKVIGVLQAVNKHNDLPFDDDDIMTLRTLASHASIAIENARLFQQSDFIEELVHELRQPLSALRYSTTLLQRPDLPQDKGEDIVRRMRGEIERLNEMANDFLDVARLESGREQLDVTPFDLKDLLEECAFVVESQAKEKNVSIEIEKYPVYAEADRGKVKRVILNLLTNAIKYNRPDGTINMNISSVDDASHEIDHPFVRVSVADTGFGISEEYQKNMFQKFYRVPTTANTVRGTGLGLSICKNIIEAHGGRIWLDSEEDVGSTFYFTIPGTAN